MNTTTENKPKKKYQIIVFKPLNTEAVKEAGRNIDNLIGLGFELSKMTGDETVTMVWVKDNDTNQN